MTTQSQNSLLTEQDQEAFRKALQDKDLMKDIAPYMSLVKEKKITHEAFCGLATAFAQDSQRYVLGYVHGICARMLPEETSSLLDLVNKYFGDDYEDIDEEEDPELADTSHIESIRPAVENILEKEGIQSLISFIWKFYPVDNINIIHKRGTLATYEVCGFLKALYLNGILSLEAHNKIIDKIDAHWHSCLEVPLKSEEHKDPFGYQVGGDHYSKYEIQPAECIQRVGLDFFRGNILKYLVRFQDKNGIEDLRKAKHYAELLLKKIDEDTEYFHTFVDQFKDNPCQLEMCFLMPRYQTIQELIQMLNGDIERLEYEERTGKSTIATCVENEDAE